MENVYVMKLLSQFKSNIGEYMEYLKETFQSAEVYYNFSRVLFCVFENSFHSEKALVELHRTVTNIGFQCKTES